MVRWKLLLTIIYFFCFIIAGCNNPESIKEKQIETKGKLLIGGKDFTEQLVLLTITSIYLSENGYDVEVIRDMKSQDLRSALINEKLDFYWEYTGTALVLYLSHIGESDPELTYQLVKELDEKNGLVWLDKTDFNNTYALLMKEDLAKKLGIESISDLSDYINNNGEIRFASEYEFYDRNDGLKGLQSRYNFTLDNKDVMRMKSGLTYNALKESQVDVIVGFATDGSIHELDLIHLTDDKSFFPAYNAVPVLRKEVLMEHKDLSYLLNNIANRLDAENMMKLNYQVDIELKDVVEVSRVWLEDEGLIQ